jgi:hypothetical protein
MSTILEDAKPNAAPQHAHENQGFTLLCFDSINKADKYVLKLLKYRSIHMQSSSNL